jgi:peroxiredoxin
MRRRPTHTYEGEQHSNVAPEVQELALKVKTSTGESLRELAERQPMMLYFMRHTGCPFCRESLARLRKLRRQIEESGTRLVLVHMSSESHARKFLSRFGLADVPAISDPRRALYRAFALRRGTLWQVAGPQLWARGFPLLLRHGQRLSRKGGNPFQLSGLFLVFHGHVIRAFLHQSAGDMPDFLAFASGGLAQDGALS